jgi:hypothetical protein
MTTVKNFNIDGRTGTYAPMSATLYKFIFDDGEIRIARMVPDEQAEDGDVEGHQFRGNQWTGGLGGQELSTRVTKSIVLALDRRDPAVWADFSVKFDLTPRLKRTIQQQLRDNIDLISTKRIKDGPAIPRKNFARLRDMARESIERGRDLVGFTKDLEENFGITRRRASLIARDQNNKMTALFQRTRQLDCGITQAMWVHTAASLKPREEHEEFDRMTYSVEEGHDFDDGFGPVLPGEAINCSCLSAPVIPGYEE